MSDKLFDLCEKQLLSIIDEASASIDKVTNSTSLLLRDSDQLCSLLKDSASGRSEEMELSKNLGNNVNMIVVNMQFFDELSQRIEHIKQIVNLIKLESSREGFLSDPDDSEDLFNNIKMIFSIKSEFEVMHTIFPEYGEMETGSLVELF